MNPPAVTERPMRLEKQTLFVTGGKTGAKTTGGMQATGIETTGAVPLDVSLGLAVGVQTIGAVLLEVLSIKSGVVKTKDVIGMGRTRILGPPSRREVRSQVLGLIHIMVPHISRGRMGIWIPSTGRPKGP